MGWWSQGKDGGSFAEERGVEEIGVWGDGPADILDNAIDEIVKEFQRDWGRKPTPDELRSGLEFSLGLHLRKAVAE